MRYFNDKNGKQWELSIDYSTIKRVKALCDVQILNLIAVDEKTGLVESDLLDRLIDDPILLVDVLYACCKPQADMLNMSDEDFGRSFTGEEIERATKVLLDEVVDFFPEPKRTMLRKMINAVNRHLEKENQIVKEILKTEEIDQKMDSLLEKSSNLFLNMPVTAE